MRDLISWISFFGAIVFGKAVGGLFYWLVFPLLLLKYGVERGALLLFSLLFIASVGFTIICDVIGKDLFGIETVRQKYLSRIECLLGWKTEITGVGKTAWVVEFVLFTWQFLPPIVLLLMRKVDAPCRKRPFLIRGSDIAILFVSSLVAILFWTFVHGKILAGFWNWIRSL